MEAEILCPVCNELMGMINKPEITERDIALYQSMMTCSAGHQGAILETHQEPE
jgi:hypothetical protein